MFEQSFKNIDDILHTSEI